MGFAVFATANDTTNQLLVTAVAVAYTAGAAARNSSWPRVAVAQITLILLPIAAGGALRHDFAYGVLSTIMLLYYLAALEIVRSAGSRRVRLLLTTREKERTRALP